MNITYDQAIALGGPLAEAARRAMAEGRQDRRESGCTPPRAIGEPGTLGTANKVEQRFHREIRPFVGRVVFEGLKFRLAGRTFYTPDFAVWPKWEGEPPTFVEIKGGFIRDDAAVKLKTAAALYPQFAWLLVRPCKGGWDARHVTDRGIGRERVAVAWIPGS